MVEQDEPLLVEGAWRIAQTAELRLPFYSWGSLPFYVLAILFSLWGRGVDLHAAPIIADGTPSIHFYWIARAVSLLLCIATLIVTSETGRRLLGRREGLVAALLLASSPLQTELSRKAAVDPWMAFFFALAGLLATPILLGDRRARGYAAAGACVGLAIASKSTGLFAAAWLLAAHFLGIGPRRPSQLLVAGAASVLAYLCASPYVLADPMAFVAGMVEEGTHYSEPHYLFPTILPGSHLEHIAMLGQGAGWTTLVLGLLGPAALGRTRSGQAGFLASAPLFLFAFLGAFNFYYARNLLPLVPGVALFAAISACTLGEWIGRRLVVLRSALIIPAIAVLAAVPPLATSVSGIRDSMLPDTRVIALRWLLEHVPAGAQVVREASTPPLEQHDPSVRVAQVRSVFLPEAEEHLLGAELTVLSSLVYDRVLGNRERFSQACERYDTLFAEGPALAQWAPCPGSLKGPTILVYSADPVRRAWTLTPR